jgi:hypothetical protein
MAEVDTTMLSQEHGAIRHDIAVESARLGAAIGSESCAIQKHIGDVRMESAENFGHTRRDIQGVSADIRKEGVENTAAVRREVMFEGQENVMTTKDARQDIIAATENQADRIVDRIVESNAGISDRFFAVGRDLADIRQGQATLSKDIELNALRSQLEAQKNTQFLSDKVSAENEKTRDLINDLKYHDLSRGLVERQTELVNCEQDRRCYRDRWFDGRFDQHQAQFAGQWAQLQSQIQAFQSQLQETRQGMVNFGTMAGVGQSSTSNNVR